MGRSRSGHAAGSYPQALIDSLSTALSSVPEVDPGAVATVASDTFGQTTLVVDAGDQS
jgi:hypothetical protein